MKKTIIIVSGLILFFSCSGGGKRIIAVATFVDHVVLNTIRDAFVDEMITMGYTSENNWAIVIESADGQPSNAVAVAEELLNLNPRIIVSISTPATKPVFDKNAGRIPHVYSFVSFPASIGIEENSKNITGLSDGVDFYSNFNLLKTLVHNLNRLGMVYSDEPNAIISKDEMYKLCSLNNIQFVGQAVSKEEDVKSAVEIIAQLRVDAIFVGADGVVVNQITALNDVAKVYSIPVFATDEGSVELGAFAGISVDYHQFGIETAHLTSEALKSNSIETLEHQQYFGKDIILNLATAEVIGFIVPDSIVALAAKVIN